MKLMIGIGGASCSGKSTLCTTLVSLCPRSLVIHQDAFFKPDSEITTHWDCPEAIHWNDFSKELSQPTKTIVSTNTPSLPLFNPEWMKDLSLRLQRHLDARSIDQLILVDGFLLYHNPQVYSHFDISFFLKASYQTLQSRRAARKGYNTLQGYWQDPPRYFEDIVWPSYLRYNQLAFESMQHPTVLHHFLAIDSDQDDIQGMATRAVEHIISST